MRIKLRNWYHSDEFGLLVDEQYTGGRWEVSLLPRHWKKIRKAARDAWLYKYEYTKPEMKAIMRNWQIQLGGGCNPWHNAIIIDNRLVW